MIATVHRSAFTDGQMGLHQCASARTEEKGISAEEAIEQGMAKEFAKKRSQSIPKGMMHMRSMSRGRWERPRQSNPAFAGLTRRAVWQGCQIVNITEDIRKYAAEQAISEEEALQRGMEEKSKEFVEAGAEVYQPA